MGHEDVSVNILGTFCVKKCEKRIYISFPRTICYCPFRTGLQKNFGKISNVSHINPGIQRKLVKGNEMDRGILFVCNLILNTSFITICFDS